MLKFRINSLEEADEKFHELYQEREVDGNTFFFLKVEGVVPAERAQDLQKKVNQFRQTNVRLKDRIKQFSEYADLGDEITEDMTPEDLANLLQDKKKEFADKLRQTGGSEKGKISQEDLDSLVEDRLRNFKEQHSKQIKLIEEGKAELAKERDGLFYQLETLSIENEVVTAATQRGLRPTAHRDIVTRARGVFRLVDGSVRALSEDGETPIYGSDGLDELKISEWVEQQASKDAPHLFESNSGGGASGGSAGGSRSGGAGPNPYKRESFNRTSQMKLERDNPSAAKRFRAEAGFRR